MDDVVQHFRDEEAVIGTAGFPAAVEHIVLHHELVDKASRLVDDYHAGKQGIGDVFQFLAYDLVTKHMLGADRQFDADRFMLEQPDTAARYLKLDATKLGKEQRKLYEQYMRKPENALEQKRTIRLKEVTL